MKLNIILFIALSFMVLACGPADNTTSNGYEYIIHNDVSGPTAQVGDNVYFLFDIKDNTGKILQSYRNGPQTPSIKIPPKEEAAYKSNQLFDFMTKLSAGDSASLFIPIDSLPNVPPGYENMDHFEYNIVITEILDDAANIAKQEEMSRIAAEKAALLQAKEQDIAAFTANSLQAYKTGKITDMIELEEGLKYVIHELGEGPPAKEGNLVSMQYYGVLQSDGSQFDNSFKKGTAFTFTPGRREVIQGWDRVIPLLREGSKASIFIPAALGYGAAGSPPAIPGNAELMFYVEVEKVFK